MRKAVHGNRDQATIEPNPPSDRRKEQDVGGYVGQLARSVGVYGRPVPRPRAPSSGRSRPGGRKVPGSRDVSKQQHADDKQSPSFTQRERAVIANLEKYTAEGLRQLSENLRTSCIAKMEELNEAREEKTRMQVPDPCALTPSHIDYYYLSMVQKMQMLFFSRFRGRCSVVNVCTCLNIV